MAVLTSPYRVSKACECLHASAMRWGLACTALVRLVWLRYAICCDIYCDGHGVCRTATLKRREDRKRKREEQEAADKAVATDKAAAEAKPADAALALDPAADEDSNGPAKRAKSEVSCSWHGCIMHALRNLELVPSS